MKKFMSIIFFVGLCHADNLGINLSTVQQKNENQINAINNSYQTTKTQNTSYINQVNIQPTQQNNIKDIKKIKITATSMPNIHNADLKPNNIKIADLVRISQKTFTNLPVRTDISLYLSFTTLDKETVIAYAKQAVKYNIPIVLRGFINNSYKDTSIYIKTIREAFPQLTILIDPPAFDKYDIKQIPALVVSKSSANPIQNGCNAPGDFAKVYGEVSVQSMLDYVRLNSKNPELVLAATNNLNAIRSKRYFKSE